MSENKISSSSSAKLTLGSSITVAINDKNEAVLLTKLSPHLIDALTYVAAAVSEQDIKKHLMKSIDITETEAALHAKLFIQYIDSVTLLCTDELLTRESEQLMENV